MRDPEPNRRNLIAFLAAMPVLLGGTKLRSELPVIYQLRIYEIFEVSKAAFHARFRDHAARLMAKHGFDIAAMWEAKGEKGPEFVYLLRWADEATLEARWASFMQDPEWSRIKEETTARDGKMVGDITSRTMNLVDYSSRV